MLKRLIPLLALAMLLSTAPALADEYTDTIALFKKAGQSAPTSTPPTGTPCFRRSARAAWASAARTARDASTKRASTSATRR